MSETMLAIVKEAPGVGFVLKEVPIPEVNAGEVKIRIIKTAICGTDSHIDKWDAWSSRTIKPPIIVGHEFVGEIAELGAGVTGFEIGDIVSAEGHLVCEHCRNCKAGRRHLCINTIGVGVNRDGCFAEYLVVPASNVLKVMPGISLDVAACFDPLGNAVHSVLKFDIAGEDVLITGAGPIGIMAAALCRFCGAKKIAVTDTNNYRLELAKKITPSIYTADPTKKTIKELMREMGLDEGFDIGLEMSGNAHAFADMVESMANGGKIVLLGIHSDKSLINWDRVVFGSQTIQGIYGREMYDTWYKMMSILQTGLKVEEVITHRFDFRDFAKGFETVSRGNCGKVVLDWQ